MMMIDNDDDNGDEHDDLDEDGDGIESRNSRLLQSTNCAANRLQSLRLHVDVRHVPLGHSVRFLTGLKSRLFPIYLLN